MNVSGTIVLRMQHVLYKVSQLDMLKILELYPTGITPSGIPGGGDPRFSVGSWEWDKK